MACHSGSISEIVYDWKLRLFLFSKETVDGQKMRGFLYHKIRIVADEGRYLQLDYYASKNELFKLKLKGTG